MQKSSVLDMVNLLPPFETNNDGENEAATTLRRGRFDALAILPTSSAAELRSQASFRRIRGRDVAGTST